jgi:hypothetical protein
MEITYGGKAAFTVRGEKSVSIDGPEADIALFTTRQKKAALKINGPGEYEVGGVLITSLEVSGTLLYAITLDDINVAHISTSTAGLTERDLAALGRIDVLLVQASDQKAAHEAIADLSPRVVIPFGPTAPAIAAALGVKNAETQPRFIWNGVSAPPKAVLLRESGTRKKAA